MASLARLLPAALWGLLAMSACGPATEQPGAGAVQGVQIRFLASDATGCGVAVAAPAPAGRPPADAASLRIDVLSASGAELTSVQATVDPGASCADVEGRTFACPFDVDDDAQRERHVALEGIPADEPVGLAVRVFDADGAVRWSGRRNGVRVGGGSQAVVRLLLTRHGAPTCVGRSSTARIFATATSLPDGRVLVAGGFSQIAGACGGQCVRLLATDSADIYDPMTGLFYAVQGKMAARRGLHTAVALPDGRVVVAGGAGAVDLDLAPGAVPISFDDPTSELGPRSSFEVFDPATATFVGRGDLAEARAAASSTVLADGRVLVVGGGMREGDADATTSEALGTSELLNPAVSGGVAAPGEPGPTPQVGRRGARLLRLPGAGSAGPWLLAGGSVDNARPMELLRDGALVTPEDAGWIDAAERPPNLFLPALAALGDGDHLLYGGGATVEPHPQQRSWSLSHRDISVALVVSAADGAWEYAGFQTAARLYDSSTSLPGGGVLVVGGVVQAGTSPAVTDSVARYEADGTGAEAPRLAQTRAGHSSLALPDGTVLSVGGFELLPAAGFAPRDTAEILNLGGE